MRKLLSFRMQRGSLRFALPRTGSRKGIINCAYRMRYFLCVMTLYIVIHEWRSSCPLPSDNEEIHFTELEYFQGSVVITQGPVEYQRTSSELLSDQGASTICPVHPHNLVGYLDVDELLIFENSSWIEIEQRNPDISPGGHFIPSDCVPLHKVAIIIPLRNRDLQLSLLLAHMHPVWQRQGIEYKVFVITQIEGALFNRAKLLNIGVSEAVQDGTYDCFVFHDVDLLLEDDRCLYHCYDLNPRHISMYLDKFSYKPLSYRLHCQEYRGRQTIMQKLNQYFDGPPVVENFGGVSMVTAEQFHRTNGFSNLYWGWGGEDDDFYTRLVKKGYAAENPYGEKCSFRMIPHSHESENARNTARHSLLRFAAYRMEKEGYSTLRYQVISYEKNSLYTNITVDVGRPSEYMEEFLYLQGEECKSRMPGMK